MSPAMAYLIAALYIGQAAVMATNGQGRVGAVFAIYGIATVLLAGVGRT